MNAKPKLVLFPKPSLVNPQLISELEDLLGSARNGDLQGLAYVSFYRPGAAMGADILGQCRKIPALTIGALHLLIREVEKLV